MRKLTFVLIGAGGRGKTYTNIAFEEGYDCELVAIAEPDDKKRNMLSQKYNVPQERCFHSYEELLALGKIADFAIIATLDRLHYAPTLMAIDCGYDILLEKPVAPTPGECMKICEAAEAKGVRVLVCHVLRYTPFFRKVKEIIDSGKLGKVWSVIHLESVAYYHYANAFVRGPFGNSDRTSDMLLQKSCHDIDLLQWLLGSRCKKVQSFGSLRHFTKENCPEGAPEFCIEGCPHATSCPYNAPNIYLNLDYHEGSWVRGDMSIEETKQYLRESNYGRCVYQMDNNVVDHQVVNMEFENGETVAFTMSTFGEGGRKIHIMGTKGELMSRDMNTIEIFTFVDDDENSPRYRHTKREVFKVLKEDADGKITGGHGGGDGGIVHDLWEYFGDGVQSKSISDIRTSVDNHMIVFAAEHSRKNGGVMVELDAYQESILKEQ